MNRLKLEEVINTMWDLSINPGHPGHRITYSNNQGFLGDKIESVVKEEHDGGKYPDHDEFKIMFKECIDLDRLKKVCNTRGIASFDFFENTDGLLVNYNDPLKPFMIVKNGYNSGMIRFYGQAKSAALEIINAYLQEVSK